MSFCRECGNELSEGQKFCNECGTSNLYLSDEVVATFCRECGNGLSEGQKFCNECGTGNLYLDEAATTFCRESENKSCEQQRFSNKRIVGESEKNAESANVQLSVKYALNKLGIAYNTYLIALVALALAPIIQFFGIFSLEADLWITEIVKDFSWYSLSSLVTELEIDLKEYSFFTSAVPIILGIMATVAVFCAVKCIWESATVLNFRGREAIDLLKTSSAFNLGILIGNIVMVLLSDYVLDYVLGSYEELASIKFSTIGILYIACSVVGIALSQYILQKE